ncbi:MAG: ECF-type sigma factor [Acidobacteriota bacterium]|nr:ECF-type sigma factor [Acidobacteriota bacterium]
MAAREPNPDIEALLPAVYEELRRLASSYLRRERDAQSMQPTALVHEVYLRLLHDKPMLFQNRAHFCAIAATAMRRILVERARARHALKRGGVVPRVTLDESLAGDPASAGHGPAPVDVLALDQALERLEAIDPARARIVELRYFGGLSVEETAEELGISPATVKRHWSVARAWLARELE